MINWLETIQDSQRRVLNCFFALSAQGSRPPVYDKKSADSRWPSALEKSLGSGSAMGSSTWRCRFGFHLERTFLATFRAEVCEGIDGAIGILGELEYSLLNVLRGEFYHVALVVAG